MPTRTVTENMSRIMTEGARYIESKFRVPCEIDSETAQVLAQIATFGRGVKVWHRGREVNQNQLKLKLSITQENSK